MAMLMAIPHERYPTIETAIIRFFGEKDSLLLSP
jgi:hypothetical protein